MMISFASGSLAGDLRLTQDTGATRDVDTAPDSAMSAVMRVMESSLTLGGFTYDDDESITTDLKKEICTYVSSLQHKLWLVSHILDNGPVDIEPHYQNLGEWIKDNNVSDTTLIYGEAKEAVLALSYMASLDFTRENGRKTLDFVSPNSALAPRITIQEDADALEKSGYTYYGAFATGLERFSFIRNGRISGEYAWADSFLVQLRFNARLQHDILVGMKELGGTIPYNERGKTYIRSFCKGSIAEMRNFGGYQTNIILSDTQKEQVNRLTSRFDVASQLYTNGYVLIIEDATPEIRQQRGSFPCTLVYTDGGSVQTINLASMAVL